MAYYVLMRFIMKQSIADGRIITTKSATSIRWNSAQLRLVETILLQEFEDSCAEFDEAKETFRRRPEAAMAAFERYLESIVSLRKFLCDKAVPQHVAKKIEELTAAA